MAATFETWLYWSDISDPNNTVSDSTAYVWYEPDNYMIHDDPTRPFDDSIWYRKESFKAQIEGSLDINPLLKVTIPPIELGEWHENHLTLVAPLQSTPFLKYRLEDYTSLVTWQHRKPKFLATVASVVQPYVDIMNCAWKIESRGFNIDNATGTQLDILGEWIGLSRHVSLEIPDNFFGYGYTPDSDPRNWSSGLWAPHGRIPSISYAIDDSIYRFFLKMKIVLNSWDGTVNGLYAAFNTMFDPDQAYVIIRDNQDMTMNLTICMDTDNELYQLLLTSNYLNIRPAAVLINYRIAPLARLIWADRLKDAEFGVWDDGVWGTMADYE